MGLLLRNASNAIVLIRVFKKYMFNRRCFVVVVIRTEISVHNRRKPLVDGLMTIGQVV